MSVLQTGTTVSEMLAVLTLLAHFTVLAQVVTDSTEIDVLAMVRIEHMHTNSIAIYNSYLNFLLTSFVLCMIMQIFSL